MLELARAELALGQPYEAGAHLTEAHRSAADPLVRGRAAALLAETMPGAPSETRRITELVEQALPEVEARDHELALRLHAVLALQGGSVEGIPLEGATVGEAIVLGSLVFARMRPDAVAADIADIAERAGRQVDGLLDEGALPLSFTGIVLGLRWSDRLETAERLLDQALAHARRRGSVADFASAMTLRATVRRRAGRLRDAEADARVALTAELAPEWGFARGVVPLVGSLIDQGRVDEAAGELSAIVPTDDVPDSPPMIPVVLARMWLRSARREHERALADWDLAVHRAGRMRGVNAGWIEDLVVVADTHHALGDRPAAAAAAVQALELARRWDTPGAIGQALHAHARVGDPDDRAEVLRGAVARLAESPARLEHGRALITLGAELRRRGQRSDSRAPLREGYELARSCGADRLAETARTELRASGVRLRREAISGADALTPSERRIAEMAADGMSNTDIAQELFLTVKTVEMHLTHSYRKLDVRRRSELAGALAAKP
jgi:DNA-binding CsgD family transcriptional regulator